MTRPTVTVWLLVVVGCSSSISIRQQLPDGGYRIESHYAVSDPDTIYYADDETAFLVGSVVDRETRGVLPGAVIRTSDLEHGAFADSLGRFRLALPPGTYVFEVGSPGFDELSTSPMPMISSAVIEVRFELGMTVTTDGISTRRLPHVEHRNRAFSDYR